MSKEIDYPQKYDLLKKFIENYIEMPNRLVSLLINFLVQEDGRISKSAIEDKQFKGLTEEEIKTIESKYQSIFK